MMNSLAIIKESREILPKQFKFGFIKENLNWFNNFRSILMIPNNQY